MPGKVNPVIPEVMSQVAFNIIGNDVTVTMAAEAGQLELDVYKRQAQSLIGKVDAFFIPNDSVIQSAMNLVAEVAREAKDVYKRQVLNSSTINVIGMTDEKDS